MTLQEKAIELVDKFMLHNSYQSIVWYNAKQCALIAVDEIIEVINKYSIHSDCPEDADLEYWQEVKQEILKL
jgi:hypothetical protein